MHQTEVVHRVNGEAFTRWTTSVSYDCYYFSHSLEGRDSLCRASLSDTTDIFTFFLCVGVLQCMTREGKYSLGSEGFNGCRARKGRDALGSALQQNITNLNTRVAAC